MKILDTFAGVGGFSLALQQSIGKENVEHIGYCEIDKFAKQVYENRFPGVKDLGDITKLDIDNLEDFDLLTGGFPCQSFSVAGKQLGFSDLRGEMIYYLLEILQKKQPKYFVFENVKGFLNKKFQEERELIFKEIQKAGYDFKVNILNTKDYGLPQNRERVFIIGSLDAKIIENYQFPKGQELTTFLKDILEEEVDEKYFLSDDQYNNLSYDSIKRIYTDVAPTLDTMQGGHRQPKVRIKNATKKGYIEGCEGDGIVLDNPNSKTKRGRVKNKISGTLTCAGNDGVIVKDLNIRKLTPVECERLQGFPDGWSSDIVSNSQAYKQMGNAISVPVVKAIFDNLIK